MCKGPKQWAKSKSRTPPHIPPPPQSSWQVETGGEKAHWWDGTSHIAWHLPWLTLSTGIVSPRKNSIPPGKMVSSSEVALWRGRHCGLWAWHFLDYRVFFKDSKTSMDEGQNAVFGHVPIKCWCPKIEMNLDKHAKSATPWKPYFIWQDAAQVKSSVCLPEYSVVSASSSVFYVELRNPLTFFLLPHCLVLHAFSSL